MSESFDILIAGLAVHWEMNTAGVERLLSSHKITYVNAAEKLPKTFPDEPEVSKLAAAFRDAVVKYHIEVFRNNKLIERLHKPTLEYLTRLGLADHFPVLGGHNAWSASQLKKFGLETVSEWIGKKDATRVMANLVLLKLLEKQEKLEKQIDKYEIATDYTETTSYTIVSYGGSSGTVFVNTNIKNLVWGK